MKLRTAFPRLSLLIVGLALAQVGISMGLSPERITGISLGQTAATSHIRVSAGGFHLGVGLFSVLCAFRNELLRSGLIAVATILACVVMFRLIGIKLDSGSPENFVALQREGAAFGVIIASLVTLWLSGASASKAG